MTFSWKKTDFVSAAGRHSVLTVGQGEPVILLHGFPDCPESFKSLAQNLSNSGYKIYAPVMRGYELSSRQSKDYHIAALAEDVLEFCRQAGGRAHVIGHDWGAVAAYAAAAHDSSSIKTLTALAIPILKDIPSGALIVPSQFLKSWYMFFFQLPFIPELTIRADNYKLIRKLWADWSPGYHFSGEVMNSVIRTFNVPGTIEAALSYYRSLPDILSPRGRLSRELFFSKINVPALIMHGRQDGCMDAGMFHAVDWDFPAGLKLKTIENAGHFLHIEKTEEVAEEILNHLKNYG